MHILHSIVADRRSHLYVLGKTGVGKSTLLKNLIIQDIQAGHGVAVIDPHGDLVSDVLHHIPKARNSDAVYFDPSDQEHPIGFNVLEAVEPDRRHLVASQIVAIFQSIWHDSWGPRTEYFLANAVFALLEAGGATLLGIPRLLQDAEYRADIVSRVHDPVIKKFWSIEYEAFSQNFRTEASAPIQNKVGQLLASAQIRNIVGQVKSTIDFGYMMDHGKIFLCDLSKGKIGEDKTRLLGSIITAKLFLDSLKRVHQDEADRRDFFLYIDEAHNLSTTALSSILSEARKYRLNLTLSHQYLGQMPKETREAILGNVGTLILFRMGAEDARTLEPEFAPEFNVFDLENLGRYRIYLKLLIDGLASRPFSARTLPPVTKTDNESSRDTILKISRERYGTRREVIEDKINRWFGMMG
jgi:hypothetical protein